MKKILAINGSYRDDGVTDQIVAVLQEQIRAAGAQIEHIQLRNYPIHFCLNCRECTLEPGSTPGHCVQEDGMAALVEKIEQADGFVFASPTNFYSATALFKRFMERLVVYAYWPWEAPWPVFRKKGVKTKRAILVSSCAAPGFLGRWLYKTHGELKDTARVVGAKTAGTIFAGLISSQPHIDVKPKVSKQAQKLVKKLLAD